ncbi:hypothetical protein QUB47_24035 [Microcoleus sp. AT9_B5]
MGRGSDRTRTKITKIIKAAIASGSSKRSVRGNVGFSRPNLRSLSSLITPRFRAIALPKILRLLYSSSRWMTGWLNWATFMSDSWMIGLSSRRHDGSCVRR